MIISYANQSTANFTISTVYVLGTSILYSSKCLHVPGTSISQFLDPENVLHFYIANSITSTTKHSIL